MLRVAARKLRAGHAEGNYAGVSEEVFPEKKR